MDGTEQDTPSFLTIGHAARDITPDSWRWGGTVTYAALLARAWGLRAAVVTALAREDVLGYQALLGDDVLLHVVPSPATTTMENIYTDEGRQQLVHAKAARIEPRHVPLAWRNTPVILVGPILHDISTKFSGFFPEESLVGMTIQGRLRSHRGGRVYKQLWHRAEHEFPAYDALFFSIEDVRYNMPLAEFYAALAPMAVMTRGSDGASRIHDGKFYELDALPAQPVDLTGAGDIFAAAFMLCYAEFGDQVVAHYYANAAAACSIEHVGASGIPTFQQAKARLRLALE